MSMLDFSSPSPHCQMEKSTGGNGDRRRQSPMTSVWKVDAQRSSSGQTPAVTLSGQCPDIFMAIPLLTDGSFTEQQPKFSDRNPGLRFVTVGNPDEFRPHLRENRRHVMQNYLLQRITPPMPHQSPSIQGPLLRTEQDTASRPTPRLSLPAQGPTLQTEQSTISRKRRRDSSIELVDETKFWGADTDVPRPPRRKPKKRGSKSRDTDHGTPCLRAVWRPNVCSQYLAGLEGDSGADAANEESDAGERSNRNS